MTDNLKKLMDMVANYKQLGERLSKISDKAELIAEAKALGLDISETDLTSEPSGQLSDDELVAVAGGKRCACILGGIGEEDRDKRHKYCGCYAAGNGYFTDGAKRCYCNLCGGGVEE